MSRPTAQQSTLATHWWPALPCAEVSVEGAAMKPMRRGPSDNHRRCPQTGGFPGHGSVRRMIRTGPPHCSLGTMAPQLYLQCLWTCTPWSTQLPSQSPACLSPHILVSVSGTALGGCVCSLLTAAKPMDTQWPPHTGPWSGCWVSQRWTGHVLRGLHRGRIRLLCMEPTGDSWCRERADTELRR